MTIRKKILFWLLVPSILAACIAVTFCYYYIRRTIEQNIFDQLVLAADELHEHVNMFMEAKKGRIIDFSTDGFVKTCTEKIVHGIEKHSHTFKLNRHLLHNKKPVDEKNILETFVVDLDGKVISSTETSHVGQDASEEINYSKVKEKRIFVNELHYSPEYGQNTFEVAGLLTVTEGMRPIGIIVNRYRSDDLTRVTRSGTSNGLGKEGQMEGMRRTGEVYIVNSEKLMITESRFTEGAILQQIVDTEGVRAGFRNDRGMVGTYSDYRDIQVLGVSRYIEEMDWVILAEKDVSEAFAPVIRLRNITIVILITSIIIIVPIAILFSARITKSIRRLVDGTRKIAGGDLDYKIEIESRDEIGDLAASFNDMTFQLGKSKKRLQDYTLNLEKKVEVKTSEITRAKEYTENLIETAQDAIICIDEDEIVNVWNQIAEKIFGYTKSEIIGQPITTIIPERYRRQHKEGQQRFLRTRETNIIGKTVRIYGITKKGVEIPIEISLSFQKDGGNRYSFMAIIRDITKRKKSEGCLNAQHVVTHILSVSTTLKEASNNILQVICKSMHWEVGVMWLYRRQGDVLRCSELWHVPNIEVSEFKEKTIEISFAFGIGLPGRVWASGKPAWIDDVVHDSNFPRASVALKAGLHGAFCFPVMINEEVLGTLEFFNREAEEPDNDLLNMMSAIGNQIALFIKRKQAEEQIKKLSYAVEQSPVSVVITDTEGNIEYVNRKFVEVTGYTSEEVVGKNPRVLKSDEKTSEEYKELWETITSGNEWRGEFSNKNKDGKIYLESASISPVRNSEGVVTHFVAVKEDITERKRAEKALKRAKEEAEAANIAKSEFLANMSHEIRTPMNGVIGMTNLLLDTVLNQEQREYTETVRESADSLLTVINDILDFSKIEAGKLEMEKISFDLRITIESIIDVFAVKADEMGLEFSCFVDPEVPSMLRGDPGRLRQALTNLVSNAMKFTNDGEVAISVSLAKETDSNATLRFAVQDTGIGIPADRVNRLFQSFSQVDASTTRKYGGTGLGLAISKQIVELMGGQIVVESEEGKGSTFWFMIALEKQPSDRQQVSIELGDIKNLHVLVVDDNGTNRYILRKYLESWHCRVEEADSAGEAMKKLCEAVNGKDPFKIALLDCCMPEVDGELLGKEIKTDPQLKDLTLVMLTSIGKRGDAEYFRKLGFAAYLLKPIKQSQLFDCLRIVTGESASVEKDTAGQIVTQYSISEDHKQRVRILLAEDNVVNQKIALRILDKKLGYNADVVTNGKETVESLERLDYDLVLMDCQMPEMDGYEATRNIRDETSSVRNHSIPIIAMTANAMKGDREKCIEAGMDDYITKPINVQKLADAIDRNLCGEGKQQTQSISPSIVSRSKELKEHSYAS